MKQKKRIKGILSVITAVAVMLAMGVTVFAQGEEAPAPEQEAPAEVVAMEAQPAQPTPAEEAQQSAEAAPEQPTEAAEPASPTPEAAPEQTVQPEQSIQPEQTPGQTDPVPQETAPQGTDEAAPEQESAPEQEAPEQEAPASDANTAAQEEVEALTPEEEAQPPQQGAPAIFLSEITAKGSDETIRLTEEQIEEIEKNLPEGLSSYRKDVVLAAYSLVGKVNYFWGGKSTASGWDNRWGNDAIVGSAGSKQTGTVRAYGLDCSGYVLWSMLRAEETLAAQQGRDVSKAGFALQVGYGTAGQWANSYEIAREDAQPGDIVFYKNPAEPGINHVGILVGEDAEKGMLVAHCSSSKNNVVIGSLEDSGFRYVRRLAYMDERDAMTGAQDEVTAAPATTQSGLPFMLPDLPAAE